MKHQQDLAHERALSWLSLYLSDPDYLEELLWGNYIEGGLEVHPSKLEVDVLVPQVLQALSQKQPLPAMDADVKWAFNAYLAGSEHMIAASEFAALESANIDEEWAEEWTNAVLKAYFALRQPLFAESSRSSMGAFPEDGKFYYPRG